MVPNFKLIFKQNIMANIALTHLLTSSRLGSGDVIFGYWLGTWKGAAGMGMNSGNMSYLHKRLIICRY